MLGSGGGLSSPTWRQILADVLQAEIAIPSTSEGAAYGAAVLAAVGCGWYATVDEACAAMVTAETVASPGRDGAVYVDGYEIYRSLYPTLARTFHALAGRARYGLKSGSSSHGRSAKTSVSQRPNRPGGGSSSTPTSRVSIAA